MLTEFETYKTEAQRNELLDYFKKHKKLNLVCSEIIDRGFFVSSTDLFNQNIEIDKYFNIVSIIDLNYFIINISYTDSKPILLIFHKVVDI